MRAQTGSHHLDTTGFCRDSVERIRRREVSRALKKVNLSTEDQEVIELFTRSLVGRLLHGPISKVVERAGVEPSFGGRKSPEGSPGPKSDHRICEEVKPCIMRSIEFQSDRQGCRVGLPP